MSTRFFLQNPADYFTDFAETYEVNQWTVENGVAVVTHTRYEADSDRPSCMRVISDTVDHGVYYDVTSAHPETKYVVEFAYKNTATQELDYVIYDQTGSATIESGTLTATSWTNFYIEATTPADCVTIRIFLRAGTGTGLAFYVDDIRCQGNALGKDPDVYNIAYPDIRYEHRMQDGSAVIDKTPRIPRATLGFVSMSSENFDRLLALANSDDAAWFDDQDIPAMVERQYIYTDTDYNFVGITNPSGTHVATYTTYNDLPNAAADFDVGGSPAGTEFSTANYQAVDGDDSNYVETSVSVAGRYGYHKFDFNATEYTAADDIHSISVTYKGSGDDASANNLDGIVLYMWDGTNWAKVAKTVSGDKQTLSYSTSNKEQAQQFVDVSGNHIYVLARTRGEKTTAGALSLKSYYIEVKVNEYYDTQIDLANKAVLSAGDVVYVKNLTQNTTLTLTTHYTIGDDRQSVTVTGQSDGDLIEVKYNQYLKVVCANDLPERRQHTATPTTPEREAVTLQLASLVALKQ